MRSSLCIGNVRVRTDLTTCFNFKGLKRFQIWIKQKPTKRNAYYHPTSCDFPHQVFYSIGTGTDMSSHFLEFFICGDSLDQSHQRAHKAL